MERAAERDIKISRVAEPNRRRDCLADVYQFLPTYFREIFYQPFTTDRREMIDAIIHAGRFGGDQSIAGPRGDGKTRSTLFTTLYLALQGKVSFPIIISKSGPRAARELKNLKDAVRDSKLLARDFPEVIEPILALGRWSSRARQQTAYGQYTNLEWGEECIILPVISTEMLHQHGWNEDIESAARAQIVASLGIEGPIRGYSVRNRRPDIAICDDLDDRESAGSAKQTEDREKIIEEDIGGLGGPDRPISRVMLCTLINDTCIAATFTSKKKPSWRGQRHKLIVKFGDRPDLDEEYISRRQAREANDPDARAAHRFYLENREAIEAGTEIANPYRFDSRLLGDDEPAEVSAYQAALNVIADRGREHFDTEYQNDPPKEAAPIDNGLTAHRIQRQVSGYERRVVPTGCTLLTQGIDVRKQALHWSIVAWRKDLSASFVIDYGVHEVHGTAFGTDEGVDAAIIRAILARMEATKETEYACEDGGEMLPVNLTLVDAGWQTEAVYAACREVGAGIYPVMGFGQSAGCAKPNFYDVQRETEDRRSGDGYFLSRKGKGRKKVWLVCADADRWKRWIHDRFLTAPTKHGTMMLFGSQGDTDRMSADEKNHHAFARHIINEMEVEEPFKNTMRRRWRAKSDNVHWFDATYYACVAASIRGIRGLRQKTVVAANPQVETTPTTTASQSDKSSTPRVTRVPRETRARVRPL